MRLVQLTDPHLFRDEAGKLRGVPTNRSLQDVLSTVVETMSDSDLCIVTGDLAQDEHIDTYRRLRGYLTPLAGRYRVVPGNHDRPDALQEVFGDLIAPDQPGVGFVESCGGVTVVGLDSHVPGEVGGELGAQQLDWLGAVAPVGKPLVVCVHHPPVPVGTRWLDSMGLRDGARLIERLRGYDTQVVVIHGHTHQESETTIDNVRVCGTPSTAFQFARDGEHGETDARPPGFRVIEWDAQRFRTRVRRLPTLRYPPA